MTPERIAELRAIIKEGVRTDRPMKNFMNIYDAANGLSEALDAIERVRQLARDMERAAASAGTREGADITKYWLSPLLAALDGPK